MSERIIKTFGRTKGRPLTRRQSELVAGNIDRLRIKSLCPDFSPKTLMPNAKAVWLEIGFGGADHLIAQALRHPDILFIGAEPFLDGVAKAITEIHDKDINNIRIIDGDVRPLLDCLIDGSIGRVFLLFPDPWPKVRHHKRRIINAEFVRTIARVLEIGGQFRFASDWHNYAEEGSANIGLHANFKLITPENGNHQTIPADHVTTRYQTKKLGDCEPLFYDFERV